MQVAFVLLSDAKLPTGEKIAQDFGTFGDANQKISFKPHTDQKPDKMDALEFELRPGGTGFIALMPVAIPTGEADSAAKYSVSSMGTGWKLPRHTAHLIVNLRDDDSNSPSQSLSNFTSLLAAICKATPAVGLYWGGAGATHNPKFFMDVAEDREIGSRLMLWTGVSVAQESNGRVSMLSMGMEQLALPDLLLVAPKSAGNDALGMFFDLLGYVVNRGKAIPEGDTIGASETQKLPVRYVPSPMDPKKKVWRVELK